MYVSTWGLASAGPVLAWTKLEVRAERGALLRVSGMPFRAAQTAQSRIRAALAPLGLRWPGKSFTLNVRPPVGGDASQLDVPLALCVLAILGEVRPATLATMGSCGSLGLDGSLAGWPDGLAAWFEHGTATPPVLHPPSPAGVTPSPDGPTWGILPVAAWAHPGVSPPVGWHACNSLAECRDTLKREAWGGPRLTSVPPGPAPTTTAPDLEGGNAAKPGSATWDALHGEGHAKTWLSIGAAMHEPVLLVGPPGVGKTSLAFASHGLLPSLEGAEALELARRRQQANMSPPALHNHGTTLAQTPPLVAPHPAGGTAGLLGSWRRGLPVPGAWALAHGGLLFLDELTEWPRPARESLRHVMERHVLDLHRAEGACRWHANPWIVAATNPCRCGQRAERCVCPAHERHAYRRKLSAPLLERFPIQVEVGHDASRPSRTWQESRDWVAAIRRDRASGGALPWTAEAESEAQSLSQGNSCSRRVSRAVRRLAEGHARWTNRAEIHDVDVRAAWDVTWMARGGWWQD